MGKYRQHQEKANRALILAFFVVAIVVISAALFWTDAFGIRTRLFGEDSLIDTETTSDSWLPYDWGTTRHLIGGFAYDDDGNENELLDDDKYVSAWKAGGASEKIAISYDFWPGCPSDGDKWINIYLDPNADWSDPMYSSTPSHDSNTITWLSSTDEDADVTDGDNPGKGSYGRNPTFIVQLEGPMSGMYMRVEANVRAGSTYGTKHHTLTIHDEAYIKDGSGSVRVQPSSDGDDTFEEGETVTINVETGASNQTALDTVDKGWCLRLYQPNGDQYTEGDWPRMLDDFSHQYVEWTVPVDIWNSDWGVNRWEVELSNLLLPQSEDDFLTVDEAENMPVMDDISVGTPYAEVGESITVSMSAIPNERTGFEIREFYVDVYYGMPNSKGDYIMEGATYPADSNGDRTFSFVASKDGHVTIEARAVDISNRTSSPRTTSVDVSDEPIPTEKYSPGQKLTVNVDEDFTFNVLEKWAQLDPTPEQIRYKAINSKGEVVYVWTEIPDSIEHVSEVSGGDRWRVEDKTTFTVPAFADTGNWRIHYDIVDSRLKDLYKQTMEEGRHPFEVTEGGIGQSLLAPMYLHMWVINANVGPPMLYIGISVAIAVGVWYMFYRSDKFKKWLERQKKKQAT